MNRQQKELVIKSLADKFTASQALFLVNFGGVTVEEMCNLRSRLREKGGLFKVAKLRLIKRAIEDISDMKVLEPYLQGQIGLVFAKEESPAIAKILHDFGEENESLSLIAGYLEHQILESKSIERIAMLPSKEVLLAQVCGTMKMPILNMVSMLNQLILRMVWTLKQVSEKKE